MNKYFFVVFSMFSVVNIAQVNVFNELENNSGFEVTRNDDKTVEIYNKLQNYRYQKTIKELPDNNKTTEANLIIELDTVNFAFYDSFYKQWVSLPVQNSLGTKYISIDGNRDGKNEVYAYHIYSEVPYQLDARARIYEYNQDSSFNFVYEYPNDTLTDFFDAGDITNDGLMEISCRSFWNKIQFFKQNTIDSYITTSDFIYNPFPPVYQPNNPTLYDIDGDGNLELIYFLFAGDGDSLWAYSNHVAKYNPQVNNYELIYYNRPQPEYYTNGISTGDFDQDGKGNFGTGSIGGKFYIYEYVGGTDYQVEFTKELYTYNAYLTTFTDDMDGNGKPEVWIGGDFASSIYGGVTRLFAFETSSPGVYEQVYQVDIRGLFSAIDGRLRYTDIDGDKTNDLLLMNANLAFGFKYDNKIADYTVDFIKNLPILDSAYANTELLRVDAADVDGDSVVEIIPQFELYYPGQHKAKYYSVFYKRDKVTSVDNNNEEIQPYTYKLYQNYPNPFNPETSIKFVLPLVSDIRIKIYNTLGKEIRELLNETRSSGEDEISWDGTDNNGNKVSSGVYFITMEANPLNNGEGGFRKSIKAVLLK